MLDGGVFRVGGGGALGLAGLGDGGASRPCPGRGWSRPRTLRLLRFAHNQSISLPPVFPFRTCAITLWTIQTRQNRFFLLALCEGMWYLIRTSFVWGGSSVGRASRSQRGGQGFESPSLHHPSKDVPIIRPRLHAPAFWFIYLVRHQGWAHQQTLHQGTAQPKARPPLRPRLEDAPPNRLSKNPCHRHACLLQSLTLTPPSAGAFCRRAIVNPPILPHAPERGGFL